VPACERARVRVRARACSRACARASVLACVCARKRARVRVRAQAHSVDVHPSKRVVHATRALTVRDGGRAAHLQRRAVPILARRARPAFLGRKGVCSSRPPSHLRATEAKASARAGGGGGAGRWRAVKPGPRFLCFHLSFPEGPARGLHFELGVNVLLLHVPTSSSPATVAASAALRAASRSSRRRPSRLSYRPGHNSGRGAWSVRGGEQREEEDSNKPGEVR
jgi:hypothetical protein